jgi:hypothetical protein
MQLMVAMSFFLLALLPAGPPLTSTDGQGSVPAHPSSDSPQHTAEAVSLRGTSSWELVNPQAATAAVNAALDVAVTDFNFVMRGFAREQLAKSVLPIPKTVVVDVEGPEVGLQWQGRPAVSGPLNTVFTANPDGAGDARVLFLFDGTTFTQRATREQGTRTTTVSLVSAHPNAPELVVVTRIEAPALSAPLVWTQRFRRRGGST